MQGLSPCLVLLDRQRANHEYRPAAQEDTANRMTDISPLARIRQSEHIALIIMRRLQMARHSLGSSLLPPRLVGPNEINPM